MPDENILDRLKKLDPTAQFTELDDTRCLPEWLHNVPVVQLTDENCALSVGLVLDKGSSSASDFETLAEMIRKELQGRQIIGKLCSTIVWPVYNVTDTIEEMLTNAKPPKKGCILLYYPVVRS
jgi:hypothetical protein